MKKNDLKWLCTVAMGVALYCVLSLSMKIPLGIGHIALDLGYVVLALYAYYMGGVAAAIVGGCGAAIMSVLSGWFSIEWIGANVVVGLICGRWYVQVDRAHPSFYQRSQYFHNVLLTVAAVGLGMLVVKTALSCSIYGIPVLVKLPKSIAAFIMDTIVMCIGVAIAPKFRGVWERRMTK